MQYSSHDAAVVENTNGDDKGGAAADEGDGYREAGIQS